MEVREKIVLCKVRDNNNNIQGRANILLSSGNTAF